MTIDIEYKTNLGAKNLIIPPGESFWNDAYVAFVELVNAHQHHMEEYPVVSAVKKQTIDIINRDGRFTVVNNDDEDTAKIVEDLRKSISYLFNSYKNKEINEKDMIFHCTFISSRFKSYSCFKEVYDKYLSNIDNVFIQFCFIYAATQWWLKCIREECSLLTAMDEFNDEYGKYYLNNLFISDIDLEYRKDIKKVLSFIINENRVLGYVKKLDTAYKDEIRQMTIAKMERQLMQLLFCKYK